MFQYLGAWSFGPFAVVLAFGLIFSILYLPETHDRTVEEVHREVRSSSVGSTEGRIEEPYSINATSASASKSNTKVYFNKLKDVENGKRMVIAENDSPGKELKIQIYIN